MKTLATIFIANLKSARAFHRLTQKQLAARVGVSRVSITQLEMGRSPDIMLSTVASIAKALGFPPLALLSEDFDPALQHKAILAKRIEDRKAERTRQIKANRQRPR